MDRRNAESFRSRSPTVRGSANALKRVLIGLCGQNETCPFRQTGPGGRMCYGGWHGQLKCDLSPEFPPSALYAMTLDIVIALRRRWEQGQVQRRYHRGGAEQTLAVGLRGLAIVGANGDRIAQSGSRWREGEMMLIGELCNRACRS
jgi:hypothetical protein